jgi:hypothetical protein
MAVQGKQEPRAGVAVVAIDDIPQTGGGVVRDPDDSGRRSTQLPQVFFGASGRGAVLIYMESIMRSLFGTSAKTATIATAVLGCSAAFGQAVQVLDSVDVFGRDATTATSTVLEMAFRDPPPRSAPYAQLNVAGTAILACQRAANQGLYCIDGNLVRSWPNTQQVPFPQQVPDRKLFSCSDTVLGFDAKKPNPCTSITVDLEGTLWVAGRKASSHSLVKVVEKSKLASCASSGSIATTWVQLGRVDSGAPLYCAREWAPGRPVLVDVNPIDGEIIDEFTGYPSILGLEERKTVVLFPDVSTTTGGPARQPIEFASGKSGWSLIGNEQLLSATLLQFEDAAGIFQNYVLATTNQGRVLAKKAAKSGQFATGLSEGPAFPVFKLDSAGCSGAGEQNYAVRVSSQSERVYLSDRFCRNVLALKWVTSGIYPEYCVPATTAGPNAFCLVNALEGSSGSQQPVTLLTGATSADGLSVAPGIGIDLRDCGFNADGTPKTCPWVPDGADPNYPDNSFNAAEVSGVRIESNGKSKMVVFQVRGIPDCRYWTDGPGCSPGLVAGDRLNITELLPQEIKSQYPVTGVGSLPAMWISEKYRGQLNKDGKRTIDLFFAIPEPGIQFRDTFRISFDVGDLTDGVKWGCGGSTASRPDVEWNVVVTGSEKYQVVDGVNLGYVETLVNDGCSNPDGVTSKRFSYYAYNLEVAPDRPDGKHSDGIYAAMVRSLFDNVRSTQRKTACATDPVFDPYTPPPGGSVQPPIALATCDNLETKWSAADEKLQRCITGSTYPRQSEAVNNCQSFLSQLGQYESALPVAPLGQDPANRLGELKARVKVLRYVFQQHFVPSIPPNGFCSLTTTGTCTP